VLLAFLCFVWEVTFENNIDAAIRQFY